MKKLNFLVFLSFLMIIVSCDNKEEAEETTTYTKYSVNGYVQKGPYLNGTSITISELSNNLVATGRTFSTQITDNKGTFEVTDMELSAPYIELQANGFYFNEVSDENSEAQLTLNALSDITDKSTLNINVLSNLEKSRVEYLLSSGTSFEEAKIQAQSEILNIFEIDVPDMSESEDLDISQYGDENAILLAISVILQGQLSVADLSELMANISTDIEEDGTLDSEALGTTLIDNAVYLDLEEIRTNLESRYESLGVEASIPDFETYVNNFIDSTDYEFSAFIEYPESGDNGLNILDTNNTSFSAGDYSMTANLPEGSTLKVKICGQYWYFPSFQENTGWEYSDWDYSENSRVFTSTQTGLIDFDILLVADSASTTTTEIYVFENDSEDPTWSRVINTVE